MWLPDWTVETHFDSEAHRHAVEMSVLGEALGSRMKLGCEPDILVCRSGYCYFSTSGILIKQRHDTTDETSSQQRRNGEPQDSLMQWAERIYIMAHALATQSDTGEDRIWLPMAMYAERNQWNAPGYSKTLAFVLRPSPERHTDTPVYMLQTCLLWPTPTHQDLMDFEDGPDWDVFLEGNPYLCREAFYLQ